MVCSGRQYKDGRHLYDRNLPFGSLLSKGGKGIAKEATQKGVSEGVQKGATEASEEFRENAAKESAEKYTKKKSDGKARKKKAIPIPAKRKAIKTPGTRNPKETTEHFREAEVAKEVMTPEAEPRTKPEIILTMAVARAENHQQRD